MVKPQEVLSSCALRSKTRTGTQPDQSLTTAPGLIVSKKLMLSSCILHTSISMIFRNDRCKGESVQTLTNKLLSGETEVVEIPALVGAQDLHGKVFIVSSNRRLFALRAFADQFPKEEGAQCVRANALLVSVSAMHLFPRYLCGILHLS